MSETADNNEAFEYVLGTLRGDARKRFEAQMKVSDALVEAVRFWEEHCMTLQDQEAALMPASGTWHGITDHISNGGVSTGEQSTSLVRDRRGDKTPWYQALFRWQPMVGLLAMLILAILLPFSFKKGFMGDTLLQSPAYVAVLTDDSQQAMLTALIYRKDDEKPHTMQLKWESEQGAIQPGESLQLWAISKEKGEIASLRVLSDTADQPIVLNKADWGLIKNAEFLLLTAEAAGGASTNQPSARILAKGFCVQFSEKKAS